MKCEFKLACDICNMEHSTKDRCSKYKHLIRNLWDQQLIDGKVKTVEERMAQWVENLEERISLLEDYTHQNPINLNSKYTNIDTDFITEIMLSVKSVYQHHYPKKGNSWEFMDVNELIVLAQLEWNELSGEYFTLPESRTAFHNECLDMILMLIFMIKNTERMAP